MEAAARAGDMEQVRALLKEHDLATRSSFGGDSSGDAGGDSRSRSRPIFYSLLAYGGLNLLASTYDYRVVRNEAEAAAAANGGSCEVRLHLKSFSFVGMIEHTGEGGERTKPPTRVALLPHIAILDIPYGMRSRWVLMCKKTPGQTEYTTLPDDGGSSGNGPGSGGSSVSSSSSSWEWSSSKGFSRGSGSRRGKGEDEGDSV